MCTPHHGASAAHAIVLMPNKASTGQLQIPELYNEVFSRCAKSTPCCTYCLQDDQFVAYCPNNSNYHTLVSCHTQWVCRVALARDCVFGQEVMSPSTRSGRGTNNLRQLDPDKLAYIKNIIAGRLGRGTEDPEFKLIWGKCLTSIGKQCQTLLHES